MIPNPNVQFYKTEIQLMLLEVNTKRKLNIILRDYRFGINVTKCQTPKEDDQVARRRKEIVQTGKIAF